MAATSGAQPARVPLSAYRRRLAEVFGAGNFRINKTGSIFINGGGWSRWGRVGSPDTVSLLFPAETLAQRLYAAAALTGRSPAWRAGVLALLRWRDARVPLLEPYPAGSAEADDWRAGTREGNALWVAHTSPGMVRQRGVVAVELAIVMAFIVVALIGGCTTVDTAIRARWPGVTLAEVVVELVDFAAERIPASYLARLEVAP